MANNPPNQEELDLRRRARRRLVGAIALALLAVVTLPMLFEPEPKPLDSEVEIRIPPQDSALGTLPPPSGAANTTTAEPGSPAPASVPPLAPTNEAAPHDPEAAATVTAKPRAVEKPLPQATAPKPSAPGGAPAAVAGKGYYLQLGSFSSEANARQVIAKAGAAGFKATARVVNGQVKVRIGPLEDRAKASDYQIKLKGKGFDPVLISP